MEIAIEIRDAQGATRARAAGQGAATLVYSQAYAPGDVLVLTSEAPAYVVARMEDSMPAAFGWLCAPYTMQVPFEEKRVCYSPKSFVGEVHLLTARLATEEEIARCRNLALNPLDCHENTGLFPHATANVETRGESVFAARNAIDGNHANAGHGPWPYESWGINQNPQAEIKIDFGRPVTLERLVITLRADFPHDNWWRTAAVHFSDGSVFNPTFEKTGQPQAFAIPPRTVTWAVMRDMQKDESDPSPFPALTQIECWGHNA